MWPLFSLLTCRRGLAILHQDDLGNFHAALRAQELNPQLRLVIAIFNAGLGERIRTFFTDCAVLSESQMAAPSLVAAECLVSASYCLRRRTITDTPANTRSTASRAKITM